jgi:hypothetical protein
VVVVLAVFEGDVVDEDIEVLAGLVVEIIFLGIVVIGFLNALRCIKATAITAMAIIIITAIDIAFIFGPNFPMLPVGGVFCCSSFCSWPVPTA